MISSSLWNFSFPFIYNVTLTISQCTASNLPNVVSCKNFAVIRTTPMFGWPQILFSFRQLCLTLDPKRNVAFQLTQFLNDLRPYRQTNQLCKCHERGLHEMIRDLWNMFDKFLICRPVSVLYKFMLNFPN